MIALIWKDGQVQHIRERHLHPLTMANCPLQVDRTREPTVPIMIAAFRPTGFLAAKRIATFRRIGIGDEFREI